MQAEQWAAAAEVVARARKTEPKPPLPALLDAHGQMIQTQWSQAAQALELLRPGLLDVRKLRPRGVDVDLRLAQCYGQLLNDAGRANAYRRVVEAAPARLPAHLGLAQTLADLGKLQTPWRSTAG